MLEPTTMNKSVLTLSVLSCILSFSACKKKEEPEIIKQNRLRQEAKAKRKKLIREGKIEPPDLYKLGKKKKIDPHGDHSHAGHQHGESNEPGAHLDPNESLLPHEVVDDTKWPNSLKRGLIKLLNASPQEVKKYAIFVANHGRFGYQALRVVIRDRRQSKAKRAFLSFLIADGHMFDPEALSQMGGEVALPYLQRAAIDYLCRLKDPFSQKLIVALKGREKPMAEFIDNANKRPGEKYSRDEMKRLDEILNPDAEEDLKKSLMNLKNLSLERGLFWILNSRVNKPKYKGLVARRMVTLAALGNREKLRAYAKTMNYSPMLRIGAVQELVASKDPEDQAALAVIIKNKKDPIVPTLQRLMK